MDPQVAAITTSKMVFLWFWRADKWSSDDHILDILVYFSSNGGHQTSGKRKYA